MCHTVSLSHTVGSLPSAGTSGFAGVSWHASSRKWVARLHHGGKQHYLGNFAEERGAAAAYQAAREAAAEGRLGRHLAGRREAAASERASGLRVDQEPSIFPVLL